MSRAASKPDHIGLYQLLNKVTVRSKRGVVLDTFQIGEAARILHAYKHTLAAFNWFEKHYPVLLQKSGGESAIDLLRGASK